MKKVVTLVLALVLALTLTVATAERVRYNTEKDTFVVVAADDKGATYTATLQQKAVKWLALENKLYEVYLLECDGLVPIEWTVNEETKTVTFVSKITGETL